MLEGIRLALTSAWRGFVGLMKKADIRQVGWYAALALLLIGLGGASAAWRSRANARYQLEPPTRSEAVQAEALWDAGAADASAADALVALPSASPEPLRFQWPIEGEVLVDFSPDELVWSETLDQWQTHAAIDIAAAAGQTVAACADGTVLETWEDPLWGKTIQIEHAGGYVSTYANLNTLRLVSPGDAVAAGQTISAVGDSAACEAAMPSHLHFALTLDGEPVGLRELVGD